MGNKCRRRRYEGVWGVLYIFYLVGVGLNLTACWFLVKTIVAVVLGRPKPKHSEFTEALLSFLSPKVLEVETAPTNDGCIVLANHVNWSDFVIDICLVPRGVYVSRNVLKFLFFPGSIFRDLLFGDCIFFKRGNKESKPQLYKQVVDKVNEGRSVIVYPEGTRNPSRKKMNLKLGLVKLAFKVGAPVYVSMTSNKETICDEHRKLVTIGVEIRNKKSNLIKPGDYDGLDDFIAEVQREWDRLWDDIIIAPS
ncbi:hypothetical protein CTAYLR_000596 [Chrysophaeum taylorii]|uniref:Phospholipid/glycerol acyltransferase domain-containing protein n=1 Tax=Chrysophaeum taylorii TaxID=2483200 RepID=A0AAD7XQY3_9STRA|nr:hypothetical protein CTAYLR_000596 [Chrysophaeum taylorii]